MATVLLAWELGGGLGHVNRLLTIGRRLAMHGHRLVFAFRNVVDAAALMEGESFTCLQAPYWVGPAKRDEPFLAGSYADVLAVCGFGEASVLSALVSSWDGLLKLVQPELIIADHSPALCLAAFQDAMIVNVGNGFVLPPVDGDEFPRLPTDAEPLMKQSQLLSIVTQVQQQRDRPAPESLTELLRATDRFVLAWPELDPYRSLRRDKMWGPTAASLLELRETPEPPRFFAYLSAEYPGVGLILQNLCRAGLSGSAYIRSAPQALRGQLREAGVEVHPRPAPIEEALSSATILVHHGGLSTVETALVAGRCQLLLPRHLEQKLTAQAVESLGTGKGLSGRILISEIVAAASELTSAKSCAKAMEVGRDFQARHVESLSAIVDRCLEHLAT